jgi:hypothetical protein
MDIALAKRIPGCEIIGIDLSDTLLEYANFVFTVLTEGSTRD